MTPEQDAALRTLVQAWYSHRSDTEMPAEAITIRRAEVLRSGRPGLLDVVAEMSGRLAHVVVGLRSVGDETHFLRAGDEVALGLWEADDGLAVCTEALHDAQLAPLLLATLRGVEPRNGRIGILHDDDEAMVLDCGDRGDLTVFPWLGEQPNAAVDLAVALERVGFNHVAAPLVRWQWEGRDLGVVQEPIEGRSGGWAIALTSLRDLYASGGTPERAGGDFGSEAQALGTMLARMHLALDRAFGRRPEPVAEWVEMAEAELSEGDPSLLSSPDVAELIAQLRASDAKLPAIRTHGDFQLARTSRTDQGWLVTDFRPGGVLPSMFEPASRSPLADVADLLWSLHQASTTAAAERDPAGRLGLAELGQAWEARNRRAVLSAYLGTPGIAGLTGPHRDLVGQLVGLFELARSVRSV
jgi:maltokinase